MKNVIKKIAAVAMAFTMLGTGTAITETIAPKTNNSIVASAASYAPSTCKHSGSTYKTYSNWWDIVSSFTYYNEDLRCNVTISLVTKQWRYVYTRCSKCHYVLASKAQYRNV